MKIPYSNLLSFNGKAVAEPRGSLDSVQEQHVQVIWFEQKYFKELKTSSGDPVHVISPGIWNQNKGPDFLKAHLLIGNSEVYGDVEIHLSANDWYHHRHHCDENYNNVVLHVSLWNSSFVKPIVTENVRKIPQIFLENYLTVSLARIVTYIDLELYPYKKFVGSGKCSQLLFNNLSDQTTKEFFQSAAAWRLLQKGNHLHYCVENPDLSLPAGIATALGYKNNGDTFLQLFLALLPFKHLGEEVLYSLALGCCGIFENKFQNKWKHSDYYKRLYTMYLMSSLVNPVNIKFNLVYHQIRPFNHPARRLACLIKLLLDDKLSAFYSDLRDLWVQGWEKHCHWSKLKAELMDHLPTYEDPYWNHHYAFEEKPQPHLLPMMGNPLKQEILINAFIPLLYCEISNRSNPEEMAFFQDFYSTFKGSSSSKSQYLAHRFFGDSPKKNLMHQVDVKQGAYQLHRDFCVYYEASCEGCPFIDNYQNVINKT
jgi:hypothetical protein